MDLLIPDSWLKEFLKTPATTKEIEKYLSLCGPSVERVHKTQYGPVYGIEVTTNRVDTASVYGIAREASAILPRFGIKAKLLPITNTVNSKFVKKVDYLTVESDPNLCPRFAAVLIKNVNIQASPDWLKDRLEASGVRAINNIVDISNYLMLELGQPMHTFDYDKITNAKMKLRLSTKGEKIVTLDDKSFELPGGDIVIEDGSHKLIDLCGVMGGKLSMVDDKTKNVLLFVQNYNPAKVRKTSMALGQRTMAAQIFEKGIDSEGVGIAIKKAVDLFENLTKGNASHEILDIYPRAYKTKKVLVNKKDIDKIIGISLEKSEIKKILDNLDFCPSWRGNMLEVRVPSYRSRDIEIPEDVIEEIARIYGYHNLPSEIMSGQIPTQNSNSIFKFEDALKEILKGLGAIEVYTLSLTQTDGLKLANPLSTDASTLRTTLAPSLTSAAQENSRQKEKFHIFEMANVYLPRPKDLPVEAMTLAGIFANSDYRAGKGVIESLLDQLHIKAEFIAEDTNYFVPNHRAIIKAASEVLGQFGALEGNAYLYYEFDVEKLRKLSRTFPSFIPIPLYPAQIEDITFNFPEKTAIGDVIAWAKASDNLIGDVELTTIYNDNFTFRVWYQNPKGNLTNEEVTEIRKRLLQSVKTKFGGIVKE